MPVGSKLAQEIAGKLAIQDNGLGNPTLADRKIAQAFQSFDVDESEKLFKAAEIISKGVTHAHSIDDFIDSFPSMPHISQVGKLAIASAILDAEKRSRLFVNPSNNYNVFSEQAISNSWYPFLIRILASGVKSTEVDRIFENVSFTSFNYDRCIEQFLTYALAGRFNLTLAQAEKICNLKPVLHPYGCLGILGVPTHSGGLLYGTTNVDLKSAAENLKTYTEQIDPRQHELQSIQTAVAEAHTIIFIGFAFHEQNMNLLRPPQGISASRIYGTAFGMSESDKEIVRSNLSNFWGDLNGGNMRVRENVVLSPLECSKFFADYQRTIAS